VYEELERYQTYFASLVSGNFFGMPENAYRVGLPTIETEVAETPEVLLPNQPWILFPQFSVRSDRGWFILLSVYFC